jgi:glycosyltransferase involved in cell wall biosynthesis
MTSKIHSIVFISGQLGLGGAEKQLYLLIKSLIKQGFEITVIDFYPQQHGYWRGPIQALGVNLISYEFRSKPRRIIELTKDLIRIKPQIVHSWNFFTNPYANICGKIAGIPLRVGSVREHPNYWTKPVTLRLLSNLGLSGLIFNSQNAYLAYKKKFARFLNPIHPKIFVIQNGIEIPAPENRKTLQESLNAYGVYFPEDEYLIKIIGVGRLNLNKNWSMLIQACNELKRRHINFFTLIIGEGPERGNLRRQIDQYHLSSHILLPGQIPNAAQYLPLFDLLCSCSNSEGIPNVIMEAASRGVPVLATDVGGTSELINPSTSGLLVKRSDIDGFINKLIYLYENPEIRKKLGVNGQLSMRDNFSIEKMVNGFLHAYQELSANSLN